MKSKLAALKAKAIKGTGNPKLAGSVNDANKGRSAPKKK